MWNGIIFIGIFLTLGIEAIHRRDTHPVKSKIERSPRQTNDGKSKTVGAEAVPGSEMGRKGASDDYMTFAGDDIRPGAGYDALADPDLDFNVDEYDFDFVQDEYSARGRPLPKAKPVKPNQKKEADAKRSKPKENKSAPSRPSMKKLSEDASRTQQGSGSGNQRSAS